jgi:hypothetical protein
MQPEIAFFVGPVGHGVTSGMLMLMLRLGCCRNVRGTPSDGVSLQENILYRRGPGRNPPAAQFPRRDT